MTTEPVTVAAQLRDLLDWAALLPVLLTRHAPTGDSSRGGRAPSGSKPPVRLDVLQVLDDRVRIPGDDAEDRAELDRLAGDHRQGLLPDLWQWARLVEAEAMETCPQVPAELPEQPTLGSVVGWLLVHTDWAETQQWADEYRADVDWWWRRLRHLVGEARSEPVVPCGRCGEALTPAGPGLWDCINRHQTSMRAVTVNEAAAIIGITLCMGHQAGVGGIFLLAPFKIQPLWYSPYIPAFFVISSFFAGLCFVLLEGSLSHRLFLNRVSVDHAASHDDVSFGLAKISVGIMLFYFALKVAELWLTGEYKLLVADTYGYWYLVEILGFVLLPALVMIKGLFEKDLTVVKFGAGLALIGIALNRFNLSLIAYNFQITEGRYVPTIMEVIVTLTVLSLEFWVYRLIVNRLPVVGEGPDWLPEH